MDTEKELPAIPFCAAVLRGWQDSERRPEAAAGKPLPARSHIALGCGSFLRFLSPCVSLSIDNTLS